MLRNPPGKGRRGVLPVPLPPGATVLLRPVPARALMIIAGLRLAGRVMVGAVQMIVRHPVATAAATGLAVIAGTRGWPAAVAVAGLAVATAAAWAVLHRPSFTRLLGRRLLTAWRLAWVYRRHWQPVMVISGLAGRLHGRERLPRLVRVVCDARADRVTVAMLPGQDVTDWTERSGRLAHGFGAPSCEVRVLSAGRLVLVFARHRPAAGGRLPGRRGGHRSPGGGPPAGWRP